MQDDVTLREVVPVWWLIVWRSVVGSLLIAGTLGFIAGVIGYFLLGPDVNSTVGFVLGALTGIIWPVVVVRMALRKHYRNFRIMLVPR